MAYYVVAQEEFKKAGDAGKGMGHAAGYFKVSVAAFDKAQKVVLSIPSNYQENFKAKYEEVCK